MNTSTNRLYMVTNHLYVVTNHLYVVIINTAIPDNKRLAFMMDEWQGRLPADYITERYGYRGMRDFIEAHGYVIADDWEDDFEVGLEMNERVLGWWKETPSEADINAMPWEA